MAKSILLSSAAIFALTISQPTFAQNAEAEATDDTIIVTGVFNAKRIEDAPIAITAVTAEEIAQQIPVSAADLLKNVPGVFVNSSLGEIRNVVFSRGVSANSLDGDGGYFYVSLQEDGLPVETITSGNFGPDYFSRPDIMLNRLEALRGGTSTVTGANAPGGIFNYISRTGKSNPGFEVRGRFGLEGDGRNPYYRADAYAGGKLGDKDLYYSIGGFYRKSDGARDPGYALNKGGQVRANLIYDYGNGSLRADFKYQNDHNGWFEFIPTTNFRNTKFAPGFNTYSSVLPPAAARHSFTDFDGKQRTYDPTQTIHSQSFAIGLTWQHDISDTVHVKNVMKGSRNSANWNTGALIFPLEIDDFFAQLLTGNFGPFNAGTTTYRNVGSNSVAATVNSFSGFDHSIGVNNLPGQNVLAKGVFSQVAFNQKFESREFQDQLTFGAELGNHQLALGGYVARSSLKQESRGGGIGLSTLTAKPTLLTATLTLQNGTVQQLTDASGFASHASSFGIGDGYGGTQNQISIFGGDTWEINDKLSIDVGVRYESLKYNIYNITLGPAVNYGVNGGGADGNVNTLYDNQRNVRAGLTRVKRNFSFLNYSGAVNYKVSDELQIYTRYTKGRKAPDFRIISGLDDPIEEIPLIFPKAQTIQQIEVGLKYNAANIRFGAYPFYSKLSNVADQQTFLDTSTGQFYSPAPVFGQIKTYGVEFNGDFDVSEMFNIRTAITVQEPKASGFSTYNHVPTSPTQTNPRLDQLIRTPSGDADNNPKLLTRTTGTFKPTEALSIFLTHNYLGKRAANRANAFYLPGFHTVDFGASYEFGKSFTIQANVNNVFNQFGILSYARAGGFLASLDRQGLTKASVDANPNQSFSVVPTQPRSFFITGTAKF
jgi:iron complex outermembrane recepter protein